VATAIPGSHTEVTEENKMTEVADQTQDQRGGEQTAPTVYHIPVCPFSQRLEILLTLKGLRHLLDFHVVDITRPRPE
jgi:glutathionyl-hydroquinone reductase